MNIKNKNYVSETIRIKGETLRFQENIKYQERVNKWYLYIKARDIIVDVRTRELVIFNKLCSGKRKGSSDKKIHEYKKNAN